MNLFFVAINWVEAHPVVGAAILAGSGFLFVAVTKFFYSRITKNPHIGPVFYSFGKNYVVTVVQEYVPSKNSSGYKQIDHSLPDQWSKLISIDTSLFGLRHKVVPVDSSARLAVVLRPNRKGREKLILFNR